MIGSRLYPGSVDGERRWQIGDYAAILGCERQFDGEGNTGEKIKAGVCGLPVQGTGGKLVQRRRARVQGDGGMQSGGRATMWPGEVELRVRAMVPEAPLISSDFLR